MSNIFDKEVQMSFREKSAWVMAALMTVAGAYYCWLVVSLSRSLDQTAPPLAAAVPYVLFVVVSAIAAQTLLAILAPRDANAPADERERHIQVRADAWSGLVLACGVIGGLFHFLVNNDGRALFHLVFASLIVAQIAEYGIQIVLFRRGG
jgi:hypothetical protein